MKALQQPLPDDALKIGEVPIRTTGQRRHEDTKMRFIRRTKQFRPPKKPFYAFAKPPGNTGRS